MTPTPPPQPAQTPHARAPRPAWLGGLGRRGRRAPELLPILGKGAHRRPQDGACLMEYVSVLAGARFNDHPRCTHPALATLARLVNDEITDDHIRGELATLAPDLTTIHPHNPHVAPTVIATCLRAATTITGANHAPATALQRQLRRHLAELEKRTAQTHTGTRKRRWTQRWKHRWARWEQALDIGPHTTTAVRSAFRQFNNHTRGLDPEQRDVLLYLLLLAATTRCRRTPARPHPGSAPNPSLGRQARH